MDIEEIKAFLETDEGKKIAEELKQPIVNKRDELQGKLLTVKEELQTLRKEQEERDELVTQTLSDANAEKLKTSGDFDAYKSFHEEEVNKYKTQMDVLRDKTANTEVQRMIVEEASKNSTSPKPLQLLLRERASGTIADDGSLVVSVKDESGKPMYYEGNPASLEHLVASLKSNEDYGTFFNATGASGSGTNQQEEVSVTGDYKDMESENFNLTKASGNKG